MEKPIAVDGASAKRMIELAGLADAKRLKVGVGLMCRHCDRRQELHDRLQAGEAGELVAFRGYRNHAPAHQMDLFPGHGELPELLWQVRRFHNFLWASGGIFSDYCIHHIDEVCWMKNAWPVKAEAIGGRHVQVKINDQNLDNYAVEYTFPDGAKFFYQSRIMTDCEQEFGVYGQGSKGPSRSPPAAIHRPDLPSIKASGWQTTTCSGRRPSLSRIPTAANGRIL
jgi:predicted dehydrogenase